MSEGCEGEGAHESAQSVQSVKKRSLNPLVLVLGLSFAFFVIFIGISSVVYFTKMRGGGKDSNTSGFFGSRGGKVAVVEVKGVILDSKKILKALERFEEDTSVSALVVRIQSPGGAVAPSQEIYKALKDYPKPVVASMGSVAASGGYYVACGAKKIFANPGTLTGSIGVIMEFANLEKLYAWAKIKRFTIKTGKFKDAGAEYRAMTEEDRTLLQRLVDDVLIQFKRAVAEGRALTASQVNAVADGRLLTGAQAKAAKLVDEMGGLSEAIEEAAKLGGISGKPQVLYPEKRGRLRWLDFVLQESGEEEDAESAARGVGPSPWPGVWMDMLATAIVGRTLPKVLDPGLYFLWR